MCPGTSTSHLHRAELICRTLAAPNLRIPSCANIKTLKPTLNILQVSCSMIQLAGNTNPPPWKGIHFAKITSPVHYHKDKIHQGTLYIIYPVSLCSSCSGYHDSSHLKFTTYTCAHAWSWSNAAQRLAIITCTQHTVKKYEHRIVDENACSTQILHQQAYLYVTI